MRERSPQRLKPARLSPALPKYSQFHARSKVCDPNENSKSSHAKPRVGHTAKNREKRESSVRRLRSEWQDKVFAQPVKSCPPELPDLSHKRLKTEDRGQKTYISSMLRKIGRSLHISQMPFCCFSVSSTNSNPYIDPVLRRTMAATRYPATGDKSTLSPTCRWFMVAADIPLSLISNAMAA